LFDKVADVVLIWVTRVLCWHWEYIDCRKRKSVLILETIFIWKKSTSAIGLNETFFSFHHHVCNMVTEIPSLKINRYKITYFLWQN